MDLVCHPLVNIIQSSEWTKEYKQNQTNSLRIDHFEHFGDAASIMETFNYLLEYFVWKTLC